MANRENVYLYSRYAGRFEVYQGSVVPYFNRRGRFVFKRNGKDTYLQCDLNPNVVHGSVVWMFERDDQKAVDLFIEHERMAIKELQEKIERREWNIKLLQEFAK